MLSFDWEPCEGGRWGAGRGAAPGGAAHRALLRGQGL